MATLPGEVSQRDRTMAGIPLPSTTIGIRAPRHQLESRPILLRTLLGRCRAQFAMFQGLVGTPTQQVPNPKLVLTLGHLKHLNLPITGSAAIATVAKLVRTGSKVSPTAHDPVPALWVLLGRICPSSSFSHLHSCHQYIINWWHLFASHNLAPSWQPKVYFSFPLSFLRGRVERFSFSGRFFLSHHCLALCPFISSRLTGLVDGVISSSHSTSFKILTQKWIIIPHWSLYLWCTYCPHTLPTLFPLGHGCYHAFRPLQFPFIFLFSFLSIHTHPYLTYPLCRNHVCFSLLSFTTGVHVYSLCLFHIISFRFSLEPRLQVLPWFIPFCVSFFPL